MVARMDELTVVKSVPLRVAMKAVKLVYQMAAPTEPSKVELLADRTAEKLAEMREPYLVVKMADQKVCLWWESKWGCRKVARLVHDLAVTMAVTSEKTKAVKMEPPMVVSKVVQSVSMLAVGLDWTLVVQTVVKTGAPTVATLGLTTAALLVDSLAFAKAVKTEYQTAESLVVQWDWLGSL